MAVVVEPSFALGELSDALSGRIDMEWYGKGLAKAVNFYILPSGGATLRPGTEYCGAVPTQGQKARLVPFTFNAQDAYCLLFSGGRVYPMQDGGFVVKDGSPYSFAFAATESELPSLDFAQSGDVLWVTHPNYAPRKIMRYGHTDWRVETPTFAPKIATPTGLQASTSADGKVEYSYCVTAYTKDGEESDKSATVTIASKDLGLDNTTITLTWAAVEGADEYKIYKDVGGTFGLAGYATNDDVDREDTTASKLFVNGIEFVRDSINLKWSTEKDSEGNSTGYIIISPGAYTSWYNIELNQRFVFNGDRWRFFATAASSGKVQSSKSLSSTLWGENSDYPQGTTGSSNLIGEVITATPELVATKVFIRWKDKNFEPDLATTPLEFENPFQGEGNYPAAVGFIQQRLVFAGSLNNPQKVWMSRSGDFENFGRSNPTQDDDAIYISLYSRQVSWIRSVVSLRNLLVLTGGTEYTLSSATTDGVLTPSTVRSVQQSAYGCAELSPALVGNSIIMLQRGGHVVRDLTYDYSVDGYQGSDLTIRSQHLLHGHTVKAWAYQTTPDGVLWGVRDDGLLLTLTYNKEHQVYAWTRHQTDGVVEDVACVPGEARDEVYLVVRRYVNGTWKRYVERLAEPFRDLTAETAAKAWYVDCGLRYEGAPVQELSGLDHLEGKAVSVLADGGPLNNMVVQGGKIRLPRAYSTVLVGLPYEGLLKSLRVNAGDQFGPSQGRRQKIGRIALRFDRSIGGDLGWERYGVDGEVMEERWVPIKYRTVQQGSFASKPFSGDRAQLAPSGWDTRGQFMLRQRDPLPMTLLCAVLDVHLGDR